MKWLRLLFLALGAAIIVVVIRKVGLAAILQHIHSMGWYLAGMVLLGVPRNILYTASWNLFLPAGRRPSFLNLFRVKLSGEVINRTNPLHFVVGDTARAWLLGPNLSRQERAASVVMDRTVMCLSALFTFWMGSALAMIFFPLPALWLILLATACLLLGSLFVVLIAQQKTGLTAFLLRGLDAIKVGKWIHPQWRHELAQVDAILRSYYDKGHGLLLTSTALNVAARFCAILEYTCIFLGLGLPLGLEAAAVFSSLSLFINFLFFFFPGSIGILEGSYALLFHLMKLDPAAGVSMEIIRRINGAVWLLIGSLVAATLPKPKRN